MKARFSIGSEVAVVLISTGFAWGCSVGQPHVRAAAPVTTSPHKQESARCAELAPLMAPLVEQRWVASASIAIVKNDEKMLCSFGSARGQGSASPDTLYEIGSLTKLFTGVLLAEQSEVGAVRLEQPLAEALPVALRTVGRPITLLDLATHRSGLPRSASNLAPRDPANPYIDYDEARLFDYMRGG